MEINELEPALTTTQQIQLIKDKGIEIKDDNIAYEMLKKVTYFRLNGYINCIQQSGVEITGLDFYTVCNVYDFDSKLRKLIMNVLENLEITFRTRVAEHIALKYGPTGYRNSNNFLDSVYIDKVTGNEIPQHTRLIEEIDKEIYRRKDKYIEEYLTKYKQVPIWVVSENLSFGTIAKLYGNMYQEDRKEIAKQYNWPECYIKSWVHHLTYVRNICAHYNRIYGRQFKIKPLLGNQMKKQGYEQNSLLATFNIIQQFCQKNNDWNQFKINLLALIEEYDEFIKISELGFTKNWKEILDINM